MLPKSFILVFATMMSCLVVSCGTDGEQNSQSQNGGANSGQSSSNPNGDSQSQERQAPNIDGTVTGRIARVDLETRRFVVRPQDEGAEPVLIRFNPDGVAVTSNGSEAAPDAIEEGQTAEVGYVLNDNDDPIARTISVQSGPAGSETLSGRVTRVDLESRRFVVRPQGEDSEPTVLIFNPESLAVSLDGSEANPDVLQEGQQVTVNYVINDQDRQVARSVQLQATAEETTAG